MKKLIPYLLPAFRSLLFVIGGLLFVLITKKSLEDSIKWWIPLCTLYNIITILLFRIILKNEHMTYHDLLNQDKDNSSFKYKVLLITFMILIGISGMIGFSFLFYQMMPEFLIKPMPIWLTMINLIIFPITIVFAEMPLYYGYSLKKINEYTKKPKFAIIYVVFFYSLQHSFIPLLFDFKYMIYRFLSFLPLALFLAIIYIKKNHLKTMMIGHGIMDFSTILQVLIISILT